MTRPWFIAWLGRWWEGEMLGSGHCCPHTLANAENFLAAVLSVQEGPEPLQTMNGVIDLWHFPPLVPILRTLPARGPGAPPCRTASRPGDPAHLPVGPPPEGATSRPGEAHVKRNGSHGRRWPHRGPLCRCSGPHIDVERGQRISRLPNPSNCTRAPGVYDSRRLLGRPPLGIPGYAM